MADAKHLIVSITWNSNHWKGVAKDTSGHTFVKEGGWPHESYNFDFDNKVITKADSRHYSVAAASIIAKVYRDSLMRNLSETYPDYGFDSHVGYGTKAHRHALEQYGVCPIHRRSYAPIRKLLINKNGK